jgi:hypothetical protein
MGNLSRMVGKAVSSAKKAQRATGTARPSSPKKMVGAKRPAGPAKTTTGVAKRTPRKMPMRGKATAAKRPARASGGMRRPRAR